MDRYGCKKSNDGILQAAEVHFASGRRTVVSGARAIDSARIVNGAEKKAFDRGSPVWPPRSNAADDRLRRGLGRLCLPSQKSGDPGAAPS